MPVSHTRQFTRLKEAMTLQGISRKLFGLGLAFLAHALLVVLLIGGRTHKIDVNSRAPIEVRILAEPKSVDKQPEIEVSLSDELSPIPFPEIQEPAEKLVPPVQDSAPLDVTDTKDKLYVVEPEKRFVLPASVAAGVSQLATVKDLNACRPQYPEQSRLHREHGVVGIRFLIASDDKLILASVSKSSGYPNLDQATLDALKHCTFKAGVRDDQTVESSFEMDYRWNVEK